MNSAAIVMVNYSKDPNVATVLWQDSAGGAPQSSANLPSQSRERFRLPQDGHPNESADIDDSYADDFDRSQSLSGKPDLPGY